MHVRSIVMLSLCAGACGRTPPSPPAAPGSSETQVITGNERLGWGQHAGDAVELAAIRYAIYVDGARSVLTAACEPTSMTTTYSCTAPLPVMPTGPHTLELASFVVEGGAVLESARSAPFHVTVAAIAPSESARSGARRTPRVPDDRIAPRGDGVVGVVARIRDPAADLALLPDGRVVVAETSGRIESVDAHGDERPATLVQDNRAISVAVDPHFSRTHFVFVAAVHRASGGGLALDVVRYREVGNTFGDRAVVVGDVRLSAAARAVIRFGPDGMLYAAFDDAGDARSASDLGSWNGKVLRMNPDGSTPRDQAGGSPVFAWPFHAPAALAWDRSTSVLWALDARERAALQLTSIVARGGNGRQGTTAQRIDLPESAAVGGAIWAQGNLLLAGGGRGLLRVRIAPDDRTRVLDTTRILENEISNARAIAVDGAGAAYVATDRAVLRLPPSALERTPGP